MTNQLFEETQLVKPLTGKVAIVTGASRGIGAVIAKELAAQGAQIVAAHKADSATIQNVVTAIREEGGLIEPIPCDIAVLEDAERFVAQTIEKFGKVDILVNNAGVTKDRSFRKLTREDWDTVIDINLTGAYNMTKQVIEPMIAQNYGRIINISSIVGQAGAFGQTNYSASKAGLIGFTKSLALETASKGITVNAICPGYIETEMVAAMPEDVKEGIVSKVPIRRLGQPEEIAQAVSYLISASFVTGQQLNVNGGLYM